MSTYDPYSDGIQAAYRIGKYEGCKDVPKSPYPVGSSEYDSWYNGFEDVTEDLINGQRKGL